MWPNDTHLSCLKSSHKSLRTTHIMYPTFASFEQDPKPLQFRIPPYNISLHTLQFQHQIMIPNPVKPVNYLAAEANCEDSNGRKCERQDSDQNEDFAAEDGPEQYGLHGGDEDGIENMGIGFVSQYPQQMMDGFGVDVSSGGEYRKEGSENAMGAVTAAERRHRRMIKNRESAARSRARKQAYTSQLEIEVGELKMENALLKKRRKVRGLLNLHAHAGSPLCTTSCGNVVHMFEIQGIHQMGPCVDAPAKIQASRFIEHTMMLETKG
ncbi:uncharacterized protein LOC131255891 isoform X2 [Magnolia sinica]|uniref:uncharacterized protein LOC131255891 isoform X2 n=1 Tax=Magnolia sinica TaxID=86752 RepID=UPI00265943D3|nr:uncharacterized protein LOC131255891 isoform X2 [Magnolia sinica]